MSKALAEAGHLRPEVRLQQAVEQFKLALSDDQQRTFKSYNSGKPPAPNDVYRITAQISRANKIDQRFGPRLTTVLQTVQQYVCVVDVAIQAGQNPIVIGVWAALRFVLMAASNVKKFFDRLSELLMRIGQKSPRYQSLAILYPQSRELRAQLHEYLIVIVSICKETVVFIEANTINQTLQTFSSKFENFESKARVISEAIKLEVSVASKQLQVYEAKESSRFRGIVSKDLDERKQRRKDQEWLGLLDKVSSHDFESSYRHLRRRGLSRWLFGKPEYEAWKTSLKSSTLLCTGILGSGKSVMSANLVEELNQDDDTRFLCYYFARFDIAASLSATEIIGSLTRQILLAAPASSELPKIYSSQKKVTDPEVMLELLQKAASQTGRSIFMVIDGLDQCPEDDSKAVLEWVQRLMQQSSHTYHLFITARPEVLKIGKLGLRFDINVATSNEEFSKEMTNYIDNQLTYYIENEELSLGDPILILKIREALVERAQSMYLWVDFQIKALCTQNTDKEILEMLEDIPKDIWTTFDQILRSVSAQSGSEVKLARFLFSTVAVAREPLTTAALREAYNIRPGDTTWDLTTLINHPEAMLKCCGSLLVQDEEDLTVSYAHHSIQQYLVAQAIRDPPLFKVNVESSNLDFGKICLTYLNLDKFKTQLIKAAPDTSNIPRSQNVTETIVRSTLGRSHWSKKIALNLLSTRSNSATSTSWTPPTASGIDTDLKEVDEQPAFLFYAQHFWLQHTQQIIQSDSLFHIWLKSAIEQYHDSYNVPWPPVEPLLQSPLLDIIEKYKHTTLFCLFMEQIGLLCRAKSVRYNITGIVSTMEPALEDEREVFNAVERVNLLLAPRGDEFTWNSAPTFLHAFLCASLSDQDLKRVHLSIAQGKEGLKSEFEKVSARCIVDKYPQSRNYCSPGSIEPIRGIVKLLNGAEIFSGWNSPDTLLHAVKSGNGPIIEVLLENGVDGTPSLDWIRSLPLHDVEEHEQVIARKLVENGALAGGLSGSVLTWACSLDTRFDEKPKVELVKAFLDAGEDANYHSMVNYLANSPLLNACQKPNNLEIVKLLLRRGAEIYPVRFSPDALYYASEAGYLTYVEVLLEYGAKSRSGLNSALTAALNTKNFEVLELLIKKRAFYHEFDVAALVKNKSFNSAPTHVRTAIYEALTFDLGPR